MTEELLAGLLALVIAVAAFAARALRRQRAERSLLETTRIPLERKPLDVAAHGVRLELATAVPQTAQPIAWIHPFYGIERTTNADRYKAAQVAREHNIDEDELFQLIAFESGWDPTIVNKASGASGILQWLPVTAKGLGTSTTALRGMTICRQLDFVDKYFGGFNSPIPGDAYVAVFAGAGNVGKPDNAPMTTGNGKPAVKGTPAYDQNADPKTGWSVFDPKHEGVIRIGGIRAYMLRRVAAAKKKDAIPVYVEPCDLSRVSLIGDSLGVGLARPLRTELAKRGYTLEAHAKTSTTAKSWIGAPLEAALASRPGWLLISLGTNDTAKGAAAPELPEEFKKIAARALEVGSKPIFVLPPPMPWSLARVREAAASTGALAIEPPLGLPRTADKIHLTGAGYASWAAAIAAQFKARSARQSSSSGGSAAAGLATLGVALLLLAKAKAVI